MSRIEACVAFREDPHSSSDEYACLYIVIDTGRLSLAQSEVHSRTQSPSYARSTERDKGLWPNPYQTGI